MIQDYLQRILTARVYDVATDTSLDYADNLSRRIRHNVWLKREDEQPIFSFKIRGAYNKMVRLPAAVLKKGVVAASAGNHAQGVALSGQRLGCPVTIFMPRTTPEIKVKSVRGFGARVKLVGDSYADAGEKAKSYSKRYGLRLIPPYDDADIIAGNGTIGLEILRQHSDRIDAIFVPVGGGGLIAGIAAYVRQIDKRIKIIGVEPDDSDAMKRSLEEGRRVRLKKVGLFADGVAVKQVGVETFKIAREHVHGIVTVTADEICAAIKDIFEDTRVIAEPSGALAIAGLKKYCKGKSAKRKDYVAILSGANMNFDRLGAVTERAVVGQRREAILAVTIPEERGSFRKFCSAIGQTNITEFNYRYADSKNAQIYAGVQVAGSADIRNLIQALNDAKYPVVDMSDNELAKLHVRHMVGGRAPNADNEIVYRFQFPERPGALLEFLQKMGESWNISMFHYRNHGALYGRVLCGIQVPPEEMDDFEKFLNHVGYPSVNESGNPAYRMFLA